MSASNAGYIVVIQDNASDNYTYGIPDQADAPQVVYTSYEEAKAALSAVSKKNFDTFLYAAYGKAYPYDSTTFEKELEKGFAPLGWGIVTTEDDAIRICVGLMRITIK